MKLLPLLLVFLPAFSGPLRAEMALQAVACTPPHAHFAVLDSISGARAWIALGDDFAGFTARAYDSIRETLILGKDDLTVRLPLWRSSPTAASVAESEPPPSAAVSNELERAYWQATARDEAQGGFMQRLRSTLQTHLATAREQEAAAAAFAQDQNPETARRLSAAKRKMETDLQPEIFLWTRALAPSATR